MNWIKNLKITNKILFSFSIGIISCVLISLSGIYAVNKTNEVIITLHQRDDVLLKLYHLLTDFDKTDKTLGEKIIETHEKHLKRFDIILDEEVKNIDNSILEVKDLFYTEKGKLLYYTFSEKWKKYKIDFEEIKEKANRKGLNGSKNLLVDEYQDLINEYQDKFILKTNEVKNALETLIDQTQAVGENAFIESQNNYRESILVIIAINILAVVFFILFGIYTGNIIKQPIETIREYLDKVSDGDFSAKIDYQYRDEILDVSKSLNSMVDSLKKSKEASEVQNWLKDGLNKLSTILADEKDLIFLSNKAVSFVARYLDAGMGALYLFDNITMKNHLAGSYAFNVRDNISNEYSLKEGIVGQVAYEKQTIIIKHIQRHEKDINIGLLSEPPVSIFTTPLLYENNLCGVMELSTLEYFSPLKQDFLNQANKIIGTMINSLQQNKKVQDLLLITQDAKLEAEKKANETIIANEKLEMQKKQLERQTEKVTLANIQMEEQQKQLITKSEEMIKANAKMEEQQLVLEQQAEEMRKSNSKMEEQQLTLEQQKEELNQTNKKLIEQQEFLKEEQIRVNKINTNLVAVQEELNKKANQIEQSSKYKSEFLANMSHELRTPLNSVILLSQLLAKNKKQTLQEAEVEKLNVINKAGKDLLNLINDILDLSKIEAGKLNIEVRDFNVNALLEDQEYYFTQISMEKGVKLIIKNDFPEDLIIRSDSLRISQILRNFMSNAFKFTKQGSVTLNLSKSDKKDKPLKFSVIDTGIGISEDKQKMVFDAFSQADGSTTRLYGGTGLGLSISLNLARVLGGEISLESQVGIGSTFSLFLPYSAVIDTNNESMDNFYQNHKHSEKSVNNFKEVSTTTISEAFDDRDSIMSGDKVVLIVEDDINFAKSVSFTAKEMGLKSLIALTCNNGIEMAKRYHPSCIILDLVLPDKSGMELLRELKVTSEFKDIPIHIVSGDDSQAIQVKKNGAIGFQMKPALEEDLIKILKNMIALNQKKEKEKKSDETKQKYITNSSASKTLQDLEFDGKKILIVDDDMKNIFVLTSALEETNAEILTAKNGKECMEMLNKNQDVELVIMDIMMPVMNGYEAIEEIRSNPLFKNLPIIAATAKAMKDDRKKCLSAGASDYITKPIDLNLLMAMLEKWISLK